MADQKIEDVGELYESEKLAAEVVCRSVRQKYAGKANFGDSDVQQRFANEVIGKCSEEGLVVAVDFSWHEEPDPKNPHKELDSPTVSDDPNDFNIYYLPRVRVIGRVDKVAEFDHDKQQFEIRAGEYDGVKGVVVINTGELKEEAKKKNIF